MDKLQLSSNFSLISFPLIVAHYEELLEYSIINQQVIHSFEIDTF